MVSPVVCVCVCVKICACAYVPVRVCVYVCACVCTVFLAGKLPNIYRVGQNHTCIGIYSVHTVSLAGKSPYIRSYTVQIYGSSQP